MARSLLLIIADDKRYTNMQVTIRWMLIIFLSFSFVFVMNKDVVSFSKFQSPKFKILATERIDLNGDGQEELIVKLQDKESIYLQVHGQETPLTQIFFPKVQDGFIQYQSKMTNLIVDDFNNDGKKDIALIFYNAKEHRAFHKIYTWSSQKEDLEEIAPLSSDPDIISSDTH